MKWIHQRYISVMIKWTKQCFMVMICSRKLLIFSQGVSARGAPRGSLQHLGKNSSDHGDELKLEAIAWAIGRAWARALHMSRG
jgi:hypothetical protein